MVAKVWVLPTYPYGWPKYRFLNIFRTVLFSTLSAQTSHLVVEVVVTRHFPGKLFEGLAGTSGKEREVRFGFSAGRSVTVTV